MKANIWKNTQQKIWDCAFKLQRFCSFRKCTPSLRVTLIDKTVGYELQSAGNYSTMSSWRRMPAIFSPINSTNRL